MKKLWFQLHFNEKIFIYLFIYKNSVLDENILLLWFIIFVMTLCLGKGIFLL
jgi:hypothetical protein